VALTGVSGPDAAPATRIGPLTATQAIFALIAITLVLRLIGAATIGWGTGEAYYLATARQLHLSYFDQPPVFLWLIWATIHLTGSESTLVVRLPFVLMFAVSTWLIFDITRRVATPLAGFYAALITNASILFMASIGAWIQPDAPMVLFWLATIRVLVEIFFGNGARRPYLYWSLAGLFLGLDFLSKYHGFFVALGTGLFLVFNRDQRRWLTHPAPWLALLIALVVFTPVIVWNAQNDWVSFGFQGDRALVGALRWDRLLRMIVGQLVYMAPWLAIPALVLGVRALFAGPRGAYPAGTAPGPATLFAYMGWPAILFFTVVALWSDTQYHFHWQAPGYMMLFMLMGAWAAKHDGRAVRIWLYGAMLLCVAIVGALESHAATGWMRNVFPGNWDDPAAQQLPWTDLGTALQSRGALTQGKVFVAGDNWIDCGYIDTQVAGRVPFACLDDARNLAFNFDAKSYVGWNAYVVLKTPDPAGVPEALKNRFASFTHVDTVAVSRSGRVEISGIQVYYAEGFRG
jgi:4-amino-4-deoxy-L-arabinose transferase-like glycosyltransferase